MKGDDDSADLHVCLGRVYWMSDERCGHAGNDAEETIDDRWE